MEIKLNENLTKNKTNSLLKEVLKELKINNELLIEFQKELKQFNNRMEDDGK